MKMRNAARVMMIASVMGAANLAAAQIGGVFDLSWSSIESGGGLAEGGSYKLAGAIGPPEVGSESAGGVFTLTPGFLQDSSYFPVPVTLSGFNLD